MMPMSAPRNKKPRNMDPTTEPMMPKEDDSMGMMTDKIQSMNREMLLEMQAMIESRLADLDGEEEQTEPVDNSEEESEELA